MGNYVQIYENVIDTDFCKRVIDKFEDNVHQHDVQIQNNFSFTQINIMDSRWNNWVEEVDITYNTLMKYVSLYKEQYQPSWPKKYGFEAIRIKRYMPNCDDRFGLHVDVSNYDNARRFLVFFIYLDNNAEGQTVIKSRDDLVISNCIQGNMLVFPPFWTHPHSGEMPVDKPKYIIGSYLHYV
jgi:hypothetical protein